MAPIDLPYLEIFRSHGKLFAHYRRDGTRKRLRDESGKGIDPADQAALIRAWQMAHEAHNAADAAAASAADARSVRPRSIADVIARYRASPEWEALAAATRLDYEKGLRPLEADYGKLPIIGVQRHHVTQIRDRYAWRQERDPERPDATRRVPNARQANRVVTTLSILLSYSIDPLGWRKDNPAFNPKRLKKKTDGYAPWTTEQFKQFCERATPEWRFAAMLALLTGQRGQDQVAMAWSDYDGTRVHVVQQKGGGLIKLWIAAHPELKRMLDIRRRADRKRSPAPLTILSRENGEPWEVNAFQKAAGKAIRTAALTGIVWHGLRGTAMSWSAEGGSSQRELMAMSGHTTSAMADHYVRGAEQERLARQAVNAIELPAGMERKRPTTAKQVGRKVPSTP